MNFIQRASAAPSHLGVLPGTFNPLTLAHLALAHAALELVDEVVFVLPEVLPHKPYSGASFRQRVEMLRVALQAEAEAGFSIASSRRGLFVEIAAECRLEYGAGVKFSFLCGRDAVERVAGWDYGEGAAFADTLQDFDLLVAARCGEFHPPPGLESRIRPLPVPGNFDAVSASEVRARIANSRPWEHLVPPAIRGTVLEIYGSTADSGSRPGS
jgi:nicotinate-nucleotide adenylyltransferase